MYFQSSSRRWLAHRPSRAARRSHGDPPSRGLLARLTTIGAVTVLVGAALVASAAASVVCGGGRRTSVVACAKFSFQTLDNNADNTFNQLLGINKAGDIAGYFGSGAQGHPNKGYVLAPQYGQSNYTDTNFPGSMQTQAVGLNDSGTVVGFWSPTNNSDPATNINHGFYEQNGSFHTVDFPTTDNAKVAMNQLLGVNDANVAVGFYEDGAQNDHGYWYDINSQNFHPIKVPSDVSSDQATGVNSRRDISGFATINNSTVGFLIANGQFQQISYPGADMTQAFGVNDSDEVVGTYTMGTGSNAQTHGFTWTMESVNGSTNKIPVFQTIDAPNGAPGTTVLNGIDYCGNVVGFYNDSAGNTHGLLGNVMSAGAASATASAAAGSGHHHKKKQPKGC